VSFERTLSNQGGSQPPCRGTLTPVILRRRFVLMVLLYITLDLSLASMPGAFVFEANDSVESVQLSRVRPLPELVIEFVPSRAPTVVFVEVEVKQRPLPRPLPPMPIRRGDSSRAPTSELSALSEDPH
jgi:hypothetical protein